MYLICWQRSLAQISLLIHLIDMCETDEYHSLTMTVDIKVIYVKQWKHDIVRWKMRCYRIPKQFFG